MRSNNALLGNRDYATGSSTMDGSDVQRRRDTCVGGGVIAGMGGKEASESEHVWSS
eukprot:m.293215 g.293215  ORF g.293215 m.293215 type:complete len:56 (-) comp19446_c0_seq1:462-629(-)